MKQNYVIKNSKQCKQIKYLRVFLRLWKTSYNTFELHKLLQPSTSNYIRCRLDMKSVDKNHIHHYTEQLNSTRKSKSSYTWKASTNSGTNSATKWHYLKYYKITTEQIYGFLCIMTFVNNIEHCVVCLQQLTYVLDNVLSNQYWKWNTRNARK